MAHSSSVYFICGISNKEYTVPSMFNILYSPLVLGIFCTKDLSNKKIRNFLTFGYHCTFGSLKSVFYM